LAKLRRKYDPISAPSLVKAERMFREYKLGKDEDPDNRINNLEDLRVKLEPMGSRMTNDNFMIQVLNSLTAENGFQMLLLEKRIGHKEKPFSVEDLKEELNLRFARLSSKRTDEPGEEKSLFVTQFKDECRNSGKIGHKAAEVRQDSQRMIKCHYI
jgi:hypothetical protein